MNKKHLLFVLNLLVIGIILIVPSCSKPNILNNVKSEVIEVEKLRKEYSNLIHTNADTAILLLKELLEATYQINEPDAIAQLHKELGLAYFVKGYFNLAAEEYLIGLEAAKTSTNLELQGRFYNNLGLCYTNLTEYQKGIDAFVEQTKICSDIGDIDGYNMSLLNQAFLNSKIGLYEIALFQLDEAARFFKAKNLDNMIAVCYGIYGNIAGKQGYIDKEIEEYHKAANIFHTLNDTSSYASTVKELSLAYATKGDQTNAMKFYHIKCSLECALQCEFEKGEGEILLGDLNVKFNRSQDAVKPYENALKHFTNMKNEAMQVLVLKKLIGTLYTLDKATEVQPLFILFDSLQTRVNEKQKLDKAIEVSALMDTKMNHIKLNNEVNLRIKREKNLIAISSISLLLLVLLLILFYFLHKQKVIYKELFYKNIELIKKQENITKQNMLATSEVVSAEKSLLLDFNKLLLQEKLYADPNLSLPMAASMLGTNQRYLSFVINQTTGQNFNTYVNKIRVNIAQETLLALDQTAIPVNEELALRVGFSTRQTFIRAFKQFTGLSPAQYKEFVKLKESEEKEKKYTEVSLAV